MQKRKSNSVKKIFQRQDQSKQTEQFSYTTDIVDILIRNKGDDFKKYRARLESAVSFSEEPKFPIHIDFETIFGCNLRCVMCTHSKRESSRLRQGSMEFGLFKKIIDEGVEHNLSSVGLDQEGEPLLVQNLQDFISYAQAKGVQDIMINTNGLALDKKKTEELLNSGLTRIHFSLDAATKKTYDKIRIGSDFKKVMENVLYFCKRKKERKKELPVTRASLVRMKHNEREIGAFIKFWTGRVDAIAIQEYNDPFPDNKGGRALYSRNRIVNKDFRCTQPWFRVVVLTDGTVLPCCPLGISLKMALGNANAVSIYDLWNSDSMRRLRNLHKNGRHADLKACRICAGNFTGEGQWA